jgi:hypothetical protein
VSRAEKAWAHSGVSMNVTRFSEPCLICQQEVIGLSPLVTVRLRDDRWGEGVDTLYSLCTH